MLMDIFYSKILREANTLFGFFVAILVFLLIITVIAKAPEQRNILISFDVEEVDTRNDITNILEILYDNKIDATFFVTGGYAEKNPGIVKMMSAHEIACHAYSHKTLTKMDYEDKKKEVTACADTIKNITGTRPIGFRAPYHRIDLETLEILDQEGFTYDASIIKGLGFAFPDVSMHSIGEIPVSSIFGIPIEDVIWIYYLRSNDVFFYILNHKNTELESYLFHPHHIMLHKEEFRGFIKGLKTQNANFISHKGLIFSQDGG